MCCAPVCFPHTYLPTKPTHSPSYLAFHPQSSGVILTWFCVILMCDPSVDPFLRGEGSGSGESDSDFLLLSYHHHGKSPSCISQTASRPDAFNPSVRLIFPLPHSCTGPNSHTKLCRSGSTLNIDRLKHSARNISTATSFDIVSVSAVCSAYVSVVMCAHS